MKIGPVLIAEILPARKRVSLTNRAGKEVFSSCNRFDRTGKGLAPSNHIRVMYCAVTIDQTQA